MHIRTHAHTLTHIHALAYVWDRVRVCVRVCVRLRDRACVCRAYTFSKLIFDRQPLQACICITHSQVLQYSCYGYTGS